MVAWSETTDIMSWTGEQDRVFRHFAKSLNMGKDALLEAPLAGPNFSFRDKSGVESGQPVDWLEMQKLKLMFMLNPPTDRLLALTASCFLRPLLWYCTSHKHDQLHRFLRLRQYRFLFDILLKIKKRVSSCEVTTVDWSQMLTSESYIPGYTSQSPIKGIRTEALWLQKLPQTARFDCHFNHLSSRGYQGAYLLHGQYTLDSSNLFSERPMKNTYGRASRQPRARANHSIYIASSHTFSSYSALLQPYFYFTHYTRLSLRLLFL